jgi:lipoprotein NlpD
VEWNNIQDPTSLHIGQQLYLSPPSGQAQPTLFGLSEPGTQSKAATTPGAVPQPEGKPGVNTDKLKSEPRAFKVPYSEHALAQLRGTVSAPPTVTPVIAKVNLAPEKSAEALTVAPSSAEVTRTDDGVGWIWPAKGKLLDGFSEATKGLDIAGKPGQPVAAAAAGKVVYSGAGLRGYGKLVIIKHNNTYLSAYAHNDKIFVKEGQTVTKGQKIAEMGSTDTDLVKLHFEIRKNGKPVDPLKHLPGAPG